MPDAGYQGINSPLTPLGRFFGFQLQLGKAGEREGEGKSLEVGRWKAGCGKAALLAVVMVAGGLRRDPQASGKAPRDPGGPSKL